MARLFRQPTEAAKQKMSVAHKGKTLPLETKQKISQSMRNYWQTIPNKPMDNEDNKVINNIPQL